MKRVIRNIAVLIVLAMVISVVAVGCSNNGNTNNNASQEENTAQETNDQQETKPAEPVTITYMNFSSSGGNEKNLEKMKEAFESSQSNVKVNIETVGYNDYFTQLQTRIAGKTASDAFELNYENFVTYAKKNAIAEIDPMIQSSGFDTSVLNQNALKAFNVDNKQYGLPASFSVVLLFYNKDLFDKAGVAYPTKDWKWEDEQKAAEKIRALGKDIYGIYQPVTFNELYKVVKQNGGNLFNDDMTKFTINTPQNIEAVQFMVDRINESNVMPTQAQMSGMGDWDLFKSGRLGMLITGVWAIPDFAQNVDFNWDVEVEPGNVQKATHFFSNGLVINKDSKNQEAAFEWIKFMSASKDAAKIRIDASWELPAVTYSDVLDSYLKQTPPSNRQAVFDSLNYLVTPPVIEQMAQMTDIINKGLEEATFKVKTVQQALDDIQKQLEENIKLQ